METRYYVCGVGYDENDCVTDHEQSFGDFDTYEEAYELFVKLQCRNEESFFTRTPELYQWLIQLEECEEDGDGINCIDVKNEWWIENPNFNESFTAFVYEDDGITAADLSTYDVKEEAIDFAQSRNWDEVVNDNTGEIVWRK